MSAPSHTDEFAHVLAAEAERIEQLRDARGVRTQPLTGLALSGGGIRSASFSVGVLQALASSGIFPMIDYLSTVSGGGYAGTALTWFLRRPGKPFPFVQHGPLDRIRRQANYLSPTTQLTLIALLAAVLQKAFLSLAVYGGLLVGFFFLLDVVDQTIRPFQALLAIYTIGPWTDRLVLDANAVLVVTALCIMTLVLQVAWLSIRRAIDRWRQRPGEMQERAYLRRRDAVERAGALLGMAAATFVVGTVPLVARMLATLSGQPWGAPHTVIVVALVAIATAVIVNRTVLTPIVAFVMLYAFLLVTHAVAMLILFSASPWLIWLVVGGALVLGAITPLDAHGSGDVYRDRLAEAFTPDLGEKPGPSSRPATQAASFPLASACAPTTAGPYHLLNAALLTPASRASRQRGRGAEAFVFSPLYCGSKATGWRTTTSWRNGSTTLIGAMAASAAADPRTLLPGIGTSQSPLTSLVLSLLGLSLSQAAPNPRLQPPAGRRWFPANFLVPGIRLALFGHARESGSWVTLADGGAFDDLGIYELVRRRIPVIIAVDSTCDPTCTFAALGTAIERVRVDFGVEITFDQLEALRAPGTTRAHVIGRVHYPAVNGAPGFDGMCVYVKACLLPNSSPDLIAYAHEHPAFPHDPTSNQTFDEAAFEAYRLLGSLAARPLRDDATLALALTYSDATPIDDGRPLLR